MSHTTETVASAGLLDRLAGLLPGKSRREVERFLKFSVVGSIGAVIDFGAFNLLNALGWLAFILVDLPFGLTVTGVGVASMISFVMAVTSNFIWNRYWTYPDSRSKSLVMQYVTFLGINLAGLVIRVPLVESLRGPLARVLEARTSLQPDAAQVLGNNGALAVAVGVVLFWNFFVNRYITYNDVE